MSHLLFIIIAAVFSYALVIGAAVYLLSRFPLLSCVRDVLPRQGKQHFLSYGVLLTYLIICARLQHRTSFFYSDLSFAAAPLTAPSLGANSTVAASYIWLVRLLISACEVVFDAFLRPWTQFPIVAPRSITAPLSPSYLVLSVLYSFSCALAQVVAATWFYGTFAVWCNVRWRYAALRTVEKHSDLWALLFPAGPAESASMLGISALHSSQHQQRLKYLSDSLDWSLQPPLTPPVSTIAAESPHAAASAATTAAAVSRRRQVGIMNTGAMARAQPRRLRAPWRSQPIFPRFDTSGANVRYSEGGVVSGGSLLGEPRCSATSTSAPDEEQQEQRWKLLRVRQRFLSAFWVTDSLILMFTFSLFSTLAASRVAVTIVVASLRKEHTTTTTAANWSDFNPYPTEGYVALIGFCYLALLRLRLRRQSAYLQELLQLLRSAASAGAAVGVASGRCSSPLLSSTLPRHRRRRPQHNVVCRGGGDVWLARSRLSRPSRASAAAAVDSSPFSTRFSMGLLNTHGFDDATLSGMATPSSQDRLQYRQQQPQSALQSESYSVRQTAAFYLNPDDRRRHKNGSRTVSSGESKGRPASLFTRWGLRLLKSTSRSSESHQASRNTAVKMSDVSPSTSAHATAGGASGNSNTTNAPTAAVELLIVLPNIPQFRFVLLVTAALCALQLAPYSNGVWAGALLTVSSCAAGTTQHALLGPIVWIATEYRKLLQCSRWTLFFSRSFNPCSMEVTKVVHALSQQRRRHPMLLQAFGTRRHYPSSTVEEDEDWVTEETSTSLTLNALVGAAYTTPTPLPRGSNVGNTEATNNAVNTIVSTLDLAVPSRSTSPAGEGGEERLDFVDAACLPTSSAATAVAILSGVDGMGVSGVLADYGTSSTAAVDPESIQRGDYAMEAVETEAVYDCDRAVMETSPTQFWCDVANKVLQQSAAHAAVMHNAPFSNFDNGSGGCLSGSFAGPASTTLTGFFDVSPLPSAGAGMVQVTNDGLGESGAEPALTNMSYLGVTDPFRVPATAPLLPLSPNATATTTSASSANVIATALMPVTPGVELGNNLRSGFKKEKMKGSMLLTAPAAARVGAAAEREAEMERERQAAAESEERERERERERRVRKEREESAVLAAADSSLSTSSSKEKTDEAIIPFAGNQNDSGASPADSEKTTSSGPSLEEQEGENTRQQQQQSWFPAEGGWLSRALTTVVPAIIGHRSPAACSSSHGDGGSRRSSRPTSSPETSHSSDPFTCAPSAEVVHNISISGSFSAATSATARALLQNEEGFARFLSCVRRDGDNTYALQSMLGSHGHSYGRRVDAKGRSALHYAVMGGFVHGVWFIISIGAEPNLLDKAGYAPLHYAVLYHTEHCLSPTITDESSSQAVQQARLMVGIPVVATASVQAPEAACKRRQMLQRWHRRPKQQRLQAAYSASTTNATSTATTATEGVAQLSGRSSSRSNLLGGSESGNTSTTSDTLLLHPDNGTSTSHNVSLWSEEQRVSPQVGRDSYRDHNNNNDVSSTPLGLPRSPVEVDGTNRPLVNLLSTGVSNIPRETVREKPHSSVDTLAAAAIAQEERRQWYGMVGCLLSLGAQVDFPTSCGLTALHLAVLQGTIGLINTLLREGANPLLGSELETQSFISVPNAASREESVDAHKRGDSCNKRETAADEQEDLDSSTAWIAQIDAEFRRPGLRRRRQPQQQEQELQKENENADADHKQKSELLSSSYLSRKQQRQNPHAASVFDASSSSTQSQDTFSTAGVTDNNDFVSDASYKSLIVKRNEWVGVHITNAGNPIAMGYLKSPLLLAVELNSDLAVASMLHHTTLQATSVRVVAGLPKGKTRCSTRGSGGSGVGGESQAGFVSFSQDTYSGVAPLSSTGTLHPPNSLTWKAPSCNSPTVPIVIDYGTTKKTTPTSECQRLPLTPSFMPSSSSATSNTQSVSACSKEPTLTAAYLSSVSHPTVPGSSHTLADANDHRDSNNNTGGAVVGLLQGCMNNNRNSKNVINKNSSGDNATAMNVLQSAGATAENIATAVTTPASSSERTCWERPCAHAFNAIHIALILGNAQVTRVLLLRWTYDGIVSGGALPAAATAAANSTLLGSRTTRHSSSSGLDVVEPLLSTRPRTPSCLGDRAVTIATSTTSTRTTKVTPVVSSPPTFIPASLAEVRDAALMPVFGGDDDVVLQPAMLQITVPIHDEGKCVVFENGSNEPQQQQETGGPLVADSDKQREEQQHHHHQHHHHTHAHTAAHATLSLTTSIGASAFWVVPLRLNFFHLAAIGDSTECLAYVLRWRGVPDYIPCALDDAFHDETQPEESRHDHNVVLTGTAAQDTCHRRRIHHRQRHGLGNHRHHSTRESTELTMSTLHSAVVLPMLTEKVPTPAATPGGVAPPASDFPSRTFDTGEERTGDNASQTEVGERSFLVNPSSSTSGTYTGGTATAVPTLRTTTSSEAGFNVNAVSSSAGGNLSGVVDPLPTTPSTSQLTYLREHLTPTQAAEVAGGSPSPPSCSPLASTIVTTRYPAEFTRARDLEAVTTVPSSAVSDILSCTWSSGCPSLNTASSGTAKRFTHTQGSSRLPDMALPAHRIRAKQRSFMRALATLLQANVRGDAMLRRVRTTVFGGGGARVALRNRKETTARAALSEGDTIGSSAPSASAIAATTALIENDSNGPSAAASAALAGEQNSVMAKTCFGSTAAAAALHTGMTICYATMNNLLHEEPHGNVSDDDDSSSSDSSNTSESISGGEVCVIDKGETQLAVKALSSFAQDCICRHCVQKNQRQQQQAHRLYEQERMHYLRQQRRRAFVSAVEKLRQCIVGVPIDNAHLAAVEMAVDRVCVTLPTVKARRDLQQALLIVTRRLQNQNRRQRLVNELRRSAAVAAAASGTPSAAVGVRRRSAAHVPMHVSETDETASDSSFAISSTTITTTNSCFLPSSRTTSSVENMRPQRHSSVRISVVGGSEPNVSNLGQRARSPSVATSAPSYYGTCDQLTEAELGDDGDDKIEGDSIANPASDERHRPFQQQQRMLQLLNALAVELNTVDTRGLTPLHYAIVNQNASMVYLLCAYGATFVFASGQTERHLVGHPVQAVAAEAAAAFESKAASGIAPSTKSAGDTDGSQLAVTVGARPISPTSPSTVITASPMEVITAMRGEKQGNTSHEAPQSRLHQSQMSVFHMPSVPVSSPVFDATVGATPSNLAAVRAQLATPGIKTTAEVLSFYSEHYHTRLTPATQKALRRAANAGSAECLLLCLPTREERELERRSLATAAAAAMRRQQQQLHLQRVSTPLMPLHSALPSSAPAGASAAATTTTETPTATNAPSVSTAATIAGGTESGAMPSSPVSLCFSFVPRQLQQQLPHPLKYSFAQPTTMAATLTEALGFGVNGSFTAVAAGAPNTLTDSSNGARDAAAHATAAAASTSLAETRVGLAASPARRTLTTTASGAAAKVAAPEEEVNVSNEDNHCGLQAQLMDQEARALQLMMGNGCDGLNNNSIAIPLLFQSSALNDAEHGGEGTKERGRGSGVSGEGAEGGAVVASLSAAVTATTDDNSAATSVDGIRAATAVLSSHASRCSPSPSASAAVAGDDADANSGKLKITADYALLEPHDVFLAHTVHNPAKADSIVRAAMEGTALRYLFQASLASGAF